MRLFRYGNVFAQASSQFCRHMDEYLVDDTRHFGLVYFQTRFGRGGHMFRRYEDGRLVEERRPGFASSPAGKSCGLFFDFPLRALPAEGVSAAPDDHRPRRAGAAPGGCLKNLLLPLTFGGGNAKLSASFPFGRAMP